MSGHFAAPQTKPANTQEFDRLKNLNESSTARVDLSVAFVDLLRAAFVSRQMPFPVPNLSIDKGLSSFDAALSLALKQPTTIAQKTIKEVLTEERDKDIKNVTINTDISGAGITPATLGGRMSESLRWLGALSTEIPPLNSAFVAIRLISSIEGTKGNDNAFRRKLTSLCTILSNKKNPVPLISPIVAAIGSFIVTDAIRQNYDSVIDGHNRTTKGMFTFARPGTFDEYVHDAAVLLQSYSAIVAAQEDLIKTTFPQFKEITGEAVRVLSVISIANDACLSSWSGTQTTMLLDPRDFQSEATLILKAVAVLRCFPNLMKSDLLEKIGFENSVPSLTDLGISMKLDYADRTSPAYLANLLDVFGPKILMQVVGSPVRLNPAKLIEVQESAREKFLNVLVGLTPSPNQAPLISEIIRTLAEYRKISAPSTHSSSPLEEVTLYFTRENHNKDSNCNSFRKLAEKTRFSPAGRDYLLKLQEVGLLAPLYDMRVALENGVPPESFIKKGTLRLLVTEAAQSKILTDEAKIGLKYFLTALPGLPETLEKTSRLYNSIVKKKQN